jgi:hypothetical protein
VHGASALRLIPGRPRPVPGAIRTFLALSLGILPFASAPDAVHAVPTVVAERAVEGVPGEIVAWRSDSYVAISSDTAGTEILLEVAASGAVTRSHRLGVSGRASYLGFSGDGGTLLAQERDSAGVFHLQMASPPAWKWSELFPVSDADPHVSWFGDSQSFLYQDILDDSLGTPSVFQFRLREKLPRLFMVGCQRPLVAPTGDAVVCVGADTLNPGPTRDIEQRQPVGIEDLTDGEFRWVAPLRTRIPTSGAWSPDGVRVALVGYGTDSTGASERRVHIHSRITRSNVVVSLAADKGRASAREHDIDAAVWSPDGAWIAVGMLPARTGGPQRKGGIWLITPGGNATFLLEPRTGTWRGAPIWTGDRQLLIADGATLPGGAGPHRYWIVDIED